MWTLSTEAKKAAKAAKKKKEWSGKVETKWHPPEGFFKQDADTIARELKKNSSSRRQAIARITFYENRAGKNLTSTERKKLERAKEILNKLYDEEEKKTSGGKKLSTESHPSLDW